MCGLVFLYLQRRLSDLSQTVVVRLSAAQLAGTEDIIFGPVDMAAVPANFTIGGRLYAEISFDATTFVRSAVPAAAALTARHKPTRLFVDFTDLIDLSGYPPAGVAARSLEADVSREQQHETEAAALWVTVLVCASLAPLLVLAALRVACGARTAKRKHD